MTGNTTDEPIRPHDDPPQLDPPPPGKGNIYGVLAGTVVPPPSTYYPFSIQVSFSMDQGLLRSAGRPTMSEPADYMSIWTLLKTSASPLTHGDTIQLQTYPTDQLYNQWGANMIFNDMQPFFGLCIWPYRESAIITDPRSKFAILRVDGATQTIVGATSVRLMSLSNGAYVRRGPASPQSGFDILLCDATLNDPENIMAIVELQSDEIKKRVARSPGMNSGYVKPRWLSKPKSGIHRQHSR